MPWGASPSDNTLGSCPTGGLYTIAVSRRDVKDEDSSRTGTGVESPPLVSCGCGGVDRSTHRPSCLYSSRGPFGSCLFLDEVRVKSKDRSSIFDMLMSLGSCTF